MELFPAVNVLIRRRAELTIEQVAEASGLSGRKISRIESGENASLSARLELLFYYFKEKKIAVDIIVEPVSHLVSYLFFATDGRYTSDTVQNIAEIGILNWRKAFNTPGGPTPKEAAYDYSLKLIKMGKNGKLKNFRKPRKPRKPRKKK